MSLRRLQAISGHIDPHLPALKHHVTIDVLLEGVASTVQGIPIHQYRGIKYGRVPGRFQPAQLWDLKQANQGKQRVDCTKFGPTCPQNYVSPAGLLRIPERLDCEPLPSQDEFECLNLTVTVPASIDAQKKLPVLIWIYGGSQIMTFGTLNGKLSDPRPIVADSVKHNKPIILVTFNYRLNIFGFGNGVETNLALKDQMLAVEWVRKHIGGFGGDKDNITLAGESAGGVYVHAHAIVGTGVKRIIAQSGSLFLSPPLPLKRGQALVEGLDKGIQKASGCGLKDAPVELVLQHVEESKITAFWLQAADGLEDWGSKTEQVEELMIGDCEYDSVIWRNGIESLSPEQICKTFDKLENGAEMKEAYGIVFQRSTSCKLGALDFINDYCFAIPSNNIAETWRKTGRKVYQYVFDQPNPWQASSRAHHGIDVALIFGGYDFSDINPAADAVGAEMRKRWISFVNGEQPWNAAKRMAFGPVGLCQEISDEEYRHRRRVSHFELQNRSSPRELTSVFAGLAMGRLSLDN
ncbi:catalytic protein [Xylogone sp. PMI_703]|nr:catalytic protein [Xylogone sp. PMI_703]